jgi:hypothetical protein
MMNVLCLVILGTSVAATAVFLAWAALTFDSILPANHRAAPAPSTPAAERTEPEVARPSATRSAG